MSRQSFYRIIINNCSKRLKLFSDEMGGCRREKLVSSLFEVRLATSRSSSCYTLLNNVRVIMVIYITAILPNNSSHHGSRYYYVYYRV